MPDLVLGPSKIFVHPVQVLSGHALTLEERAGGWDANHDLFEALELVEHYFIHVVNGTVQDVMKVMMLEYQSGGVVVYDLFGLFGTVAGSKTPISVTNLVDCKGIKERLSNFRNLSAD